MEAATSWSATMSSGRTETDPEAGATRTEANAMTGPTPAVADAAGIVASTSVTFLTNLSGKI